MYKVIPTILPVILLVACSAQAPDRQDSMSGSMDMAGMESDYVQVNDTRLFYREAGAGTPIVLVHGWPLSGRLFTKNMAELAQNHHVIAIDLRGYGRSDPPENPSEVRVDTYAQDVLAAMDEMGIDQAVIGGMSMGGPTVLSMYQMAPERFTGLLLIDTVAAAAPPQEKQLWLGWGENIRANGVGAIPEATMDEMLTADARMQRADLVNLISSMMTSASEQGAIAGTQALAYRPNFRPMLGDIDVPTLILVGKQDSIYPYEFAQYMQQHIPDAELEILGDASHAAILEAADQANEAILTWMDGMAASGN